MVFENPAERNQRIAGVLRNFLRERWLTAANFARDIYLGVQCEPPSSCGVDWFIEHHPSPTVFLGEWEWSLETSWLGDVHQGCVLGRTPLLPVLWIGIGAKRFAVTRFKLFEFLLCEILKTLHFRHNK